MTKKEFKHEYLSVGILHIQRTHGFVRDEWVKGLVKESEELWEKIEVLASKDVLNSEK